MNIEEVTRFVTDLFNKNMLYIYICKASHNVLRFAKGLTGWRFPTQFNKYDYFVWEHAVL
jgi:hypothetical protein